MSSVSFPLVEIRPVANAQNAWVALLVRTVGQAVDAAFLQALFGTPALLDAIAPLDCIVRLDHVDVLTPTVLTLLPPNRVALAVAASALAGEGGERAGRRLVELQRDGYRVLLDGPAPEGVRVPPGLNTVARDVGGAAPRPDTLSTLSGPHLAHNVDNVVRQRACAAAGFGWFSGDYVLQNPQAEGDDGTSRRRLLAMLALLARDADGRELEIQLKQDPGLSYHLLKLVNSAAFSGGVTITGFNQAIGRLGRRQLQRWLQLLLYAHPHPDGAPNLLLPAAALRGAALEALCRHDGGDRDAQELAFMTGVFSLLDRLFHMPMAAVLDGLPLPDFVEAALLRREGLLGRRLRLAEAPGPEQDMLDGAGVDARTWWDIQLRACRWAIEVARNV